MRDVFDLFLCKCRDALPVRARMFLEQIGPDGVCVAVMQDNDGSDQVGAICASSGQRSVATGTVWSVHGPASISGLRVDDLYVARAHLKAALSAATRRCWIACRPHGREIVCK